jgi:hypothetical protein
MRTCWLVMVLAACSAPRPHADVDGGEVDAAEPGEYMSYRRPTAALVGASRVAWSLSGPTCPLEGGGDCAPAEPTVLTAELATGTPTPWFSTRQGVTIVGDENELFFINNDDWTNGYLVRVRPASPISAHKAMSIPNYDVRIIGVDDTYVYWFEPGINSLPIGYRRATRAGDGSDAVTLQGISGGTIHAGYFWNVSCTNGTNCELRRTPVTGGAAETMANVNGGILGASGNELFLDESNGELSAKYRIIAVSMTDGSTRALTEFLAYGERPFSLVFAGETLYWSTALGQVIRLPVAGGTRETVPGVQLDASGPFVVTADAILYDFTAKGYQTAPL